MSRVGIAEHVAVEHLRESVVGEGEVADQVMEAGAHVSQIEVGLSEAHLHVGRHGHLAEEALGGSSVALSPSLDVAPDRVVRHICLAFLAQPLPNALGRMALLVPVAPILFKPTVDDRCIPVHHRRSLLLHRQSRRQVTGL